MAITAVIFDYGRVLSNSEDLAAKERLIAISGLDESTLFQSYWRFRHAYDLGELNGVSYWAEVARDAGVTFTPEQVESLIETDIHASGDYRRHLAQVLSIRALTDAARRAGVDVPKFV